jgi:ubiquinone/menaquinone biosynthesis C-methylase UbiE
METLNRELDRVKTRSDYKKIVWFYDFWSWLTESKAAKKVIEFSAIKSGENILEVACGTGIVFEQIVSKNPDGKNTGIDLSPDMLKKAKGRLKKLENASYELKEGDALNLDFQDNFFDIVVNNFMVDLMPVDMFDKVANEFYRVTKPGGILVVSTFSFGKKKVNKIWQWVAKRFPDLLTGCRPVSFKKYLISAGFEIERNIEISQNTFPSEIIKGIK